MAFVSGIGKTNIDLIYSGLHRLPNEGEELYAPDFSLCLGGGIPGTMVTAGRLGLPVRLATWLGDDLFSSFAKAEFEKSGVRAVNLHTGGGCPLNISTAAITPGDRTFVSWGEEPVFDEATLQRAYAVSTGAAVAEMHMGLLPVYRKLKAEGTKLILDIGFSEDMSFEKYKDYIEIADYFVPNKKEALKITGTDDPFRALQILSNYFDRAVVKLDKDGCLGMENGEAFFVKSIADFTCADSTGAGDAFLAGFIYGVYHGYSLRDCIVFGNITGGKCVTAVGCLSAYVTEAELLSLFQKYKDVI